MKINRYTHDQFGALRTIDRGRGPLFVAKDVCVALGLNVRDSVRHLDTDEKSYVSRRHLGLSPGRDMVLINEPGLYSLILRSRKVGARHFKRWVTHEVLPAIRRHGAYATPDFIESALADPETMIRALQALQSEREKSQALEAENLLMRPKALFADAVASSSSTILVREMAKLLCQNGIQIGQNRFFEWLRDNGYLIRSKGMDWNMPTQKSIEQGLFEVSVGTVLRSNGENQLTKTPRVTGKGQRYFINLFLDRGGQAA